jgi:uncharacterized protein YbjT (DUF2867 family)
MDALVLLTGATGYIGGRLLRHFEEAGRQVRCLARNPERVRATRSTTEVPLFRPPVGLWLTGDTGAGTAGPRAGGRLKNPTVVRSSARDALR